MVIASYVEVDWWEDDLGRFEPRHGGIRLIRKVTSGSHGREAGTGQREEDVAPWPVATRL